MPRALSAVACVVLLGLAVSCADHPAVVHAGNAEARVTSSGAASFPSTPAAPSEEGAAVPVSDRDPVWGSRRAPVSLVLFGDLECPYTGRILKTVHALEAKYGQDTLRVVWKDLPLPFHKQAQPAAEAAEVVYALGKGDAFWRFWEEALNHQTELSPASFEAWAGIAGVDLASFHRALDARVGSAKVEGDKAVAARLGVEGTPTFFVNGVAVVGAQPVDRFVALIDVELAKAKARLAAGVPPDAIYADAAGTNWKPPQPDDDDDKEDAKTVWSVPVGNAPVRGNVAASVTIVEFSDFQCPFCGRVEPTLRQIRETYGDKVRIVWKDEPLPFHKRALPCAELAREARAEKGDAGFWAAHDALFASQPKLDDTDLDGIVSSVGLDAGRVKSAIAGQRYDAGIQTDLDLAEDVRAAGTPHFFINGRRLSGAQPLAAFKAIIDEEIHHAEGMLAHGVAPKDLYAAMTKDGAKAPLPEVHIAAVRAKAPFKGPVNAPVVIEEFADFQCPYCARADATLAEVGARYGNKVKLVWRNLPLPFHGHAREAAEAAAEAQRQKGNVGFWAMHDKLFTHAGDHDGDGSGLARTALDGYARDLGLDVAAFDRALDGRTHEAEIAEDEVAATAAGIEGTPAFLVGGYLVAGAQPFGAFRRIIEQVLASGAAKPVPKPPAEK